MSIFYTDSGSFRDIQVTGSLGVTGGITVTGTTIAGFNPTPLAGTIKDGVTSVLGSLQDWNSEYYSGEVLYSELAGESISFGQLCYRDSFGKWLKAFANIADPTSYNMLGICLYNAADSGSTSILTKGYVETTYITSGDPGDPIFISAAAGTAGSITATAPSTAGNVVRVIGNIFWDSASQTNSKWIVYFNPDNTWIEL
jgi:hypothetical protein